MLNRYPLWKTLMVLFAVLITGLYALPNLYGEDPAVQISGARGASVDYTAVDLVTNILAEQDLTPKASTFENGTVLVRFENSDQQTLAKDTLSEALSKDDYIVALNLAPATPSWLQSIGAQPMKLGLDLRGGVHFLMEVDMASAMDKRLAQLEDSFRDELTKAQLRWGVLERVDDTIRVTFSSPERLEKAVSILTPSNTNVELIADPARRTLTAQYSEAQLTEMRENAVVQNITILRKRVNELGVAEPVVQRQGATRIVVELPGIQDTARAKEILGATATLEFREVVDNYDRNALASGRIPAGTEIKLDSNGEPVLLKRRAILGGSHITNANSAQDENGMPQVSISLDSEGGDKMSQYSRSNINKLMATVFTEYKDSGRDNEDGSAILDKHEEVINQATIQTTLGRSFRITGLDSAAEAQNLALLLRAGALIAPISIVEERTIGPSMGQQNIDKGMRAMIAGLAMVMIFTLLYYRRFGLFANIALMMNLVMVVGLMSMIPGATMTLPGIAGIVLTIGMAVDANVLIFERIREELQDGRSPQQAIHHGYANALSTIADANITTLITAIILFAVGTGAIKGFAVTLSLGILTSMFTAIIGTRAIVNLVYGGKRVDKLSI
uniref:protein translocase subunit SecD n=1 Tax=Thaumasiovibrio occultus TaxID=1891184 RepID=UPI000B361227|nr:protein translocase subunit SecD [Thaumasiovibrio occultus]